jgi:NitT/TauT family transport system permease protein
MKRSKAPLLVRCRQIIFNLITFTVVLVIWQLAAAAYKSDLLLPPPWKTAKAFLFIIHDVETLKNLLLTLQRVTIGFCIALFSGMTLGFLMGYSRTAMQLIDPVLGTVRQVPIMAWVPLTIVWFGLGDGPTVFLIAMVGVFPVLLNTIAGVQSISKDYYNAARTMGAGSWSIFKDIMVPAALPDILTGMRLAVSAGWMSVI